MSDGRYFLALASGVPAWMAHFLPITVMVTLLCVGGLLSTGRLLRDRPARLALLCLVPGVLNVGILSLGVVFRYRGPPPWMGGQPPAYPEWLIGGLVLAHLPVGMVLNRLAGCQWKATASSSVAWGWASVCAAIEAGMSVSGEWL
jgi:hypothetical protein